MAKPVDQRGRWTPKDRTKQHLIVGTYRLGSKEIAEVACGREYPLDDRVTDEPAEGEACKGCLGSYWAKELGKA